MVLSFVYTVYSSFLSDKQVFSFNIHTKEIAIFIFTPLELPIRYPYPLENPLIQNIIPTIQSHNNRVYI